MPTKSVDIECPHCKKENEVDFDFWNASDGDEEIETIECDCGCTFDLSCEIEVDYDFDVGKISNIVLPPENEDAPYVSRDPNQLAIPL